MCEDQKADEEELKVSEDDGSQILAGESADDVNALSILTPVVPMPSIENVSRFSEWNE